MPRIPTKDAQGNPNGWLLPVWNIHEGPSISQVYITAIAEGAVKGPHLHMKRRGLFRVIQGDVLLVIRTDNGYLRVPLEDECVAVPPGMPAALYNVGKGEAMVINMPKPAWRKNDQDEWLVDGWDFTL